MDLMNMLAAVRNDRVQFATFRPEGSPFAVLERRVVVIQPEELVELTRVGDLGVLEELVKMLADPDRAWAAQVALASMTRREEDIVNSFASTPDQWWSTVGQTAYERWSRWLMQAREQLRWDPADQLFVETDKDD